MLDWFRIDVVLIAPDTWAMNTLIIIGVSAEECVLTERLAAFGNI